MDQLIELEKYLNDFIDMQDNDIVKLTLTIVLQKVHRMMDKIMKDIEKEQAFKTLEERDELLDKIRAEIENYIHDQQAEDESIWGDYILHIIDKYKSESEDK